MRGPLFGFCGRYFFLYPPFVRLRCTSEALTLVSLSDIPSVRTPPLPIYPLKTSTSNPLKIFNTQTRTPIPQDGALLAIGSLAEELKRKRKYRPSIEPMILHHVLPCFASRFGHLRSKACWVAGQFCDTKFGQGEDRKRGAGALFTMLLQNVCERLRDAELPVRVDATVALRSLVDTIDDVSILGPALPPILEAFFQLMGEVRGISYLE